MQALWWKRLDFQTTMIRIVACLFLKHVHIISIPKELHSYPRRPKRKSEKSLFKSAAQKSLFIGTPVVVSDRLLKPN